ncbi:MAG: DUF4263 domain-containing protein [Kiritimatiellae bacterium]|nr:DUF4263 domain-containing protein [Kiritimatiellia bacterium]
MNSTRIKEPESENGEANELEGLFHVQPSSSKSMHRRPKNVAPISFVKNDDELLLVYSPKNGAKFVDETIESADECYVVGGVFRFIKDDIKDYGAEATASRTFIIGKKDSTDDNYYRLPSRILSIKHDLLFYKDVEVNIAWFSHYYMNSRISIFQKIAKMTDEEIIIGGPQSNAIPQESWEKIVSLFPCETEVSHYIESRVESILREYLPTIKEGTSLLKQYLAKLRRKAPSANSVADWKAFDAYEFEKYKCLRDLLVKMLDEETLFESDWEDYILRFILLLYPQYIFVKQQLVIHERVTDPKKSTLRRLDLALFTVEGHLDLIEIKRPSVGSLFRLGHDHDNNIPSLALSKTIMQLEKYILYLQKGGYELENELNKENPGLLPNNTTIKINNPRGIIVFGRSNSLSHDQIADFQVIRRKFAHIADIITYDDLLKRFTNILAKFSTGAVQPRDGG